MKKYFQESLDIIIDILNNPVFPNDEINVQKNKFRQSLRVNQEKVSHLAREEFLWKLFGNNCYGRKSEEKDLDNIIHDNLVNFHHLNYANGPEYIILSGNISKDEINHLKDAIKNNTNWQLINRNFPDTVSNAVTAGQYLINKNDAVQSGLRIGRMLFNRLHNDYDEFLILNTLLGGYFGSRLMANIREDKGYTYGIGSGVATFCHTGYFTISSEVGKDVTQLAIKEIFFELNRLREKLVGLDELNRVKSYMLGELLSESDGIFAQVNTLNKFLKLGIGEVHHLKRIDSIKNCSPETIHNLAVKYLNPENLVIVVCGDRQQNEN